MQITKTKGVILGIILSLFMTNNSFGQKRVKGNGNVVIQEREISSFDQLEIQGVYNIFLEQGDKESVKVEADENLQEIITVENKGNTLVLGWKKGWSVRKKTKMDVYITLKNIKKIEVEGVGSVNTKSPLSFETLDLNISGVGQTALELEGNTFNGKVNALGSLTLKGKVDNVDLTNTGIGALKAFELITQKLELNNSGIGKVEVYADNTLDITSSGIGSVRYKGNSKHQNIKSSGLGKVTQVD